MSITPEELQQRYACRHTRNLIDSWTAPPGIEMLVVGDHVARRTNVVMISQGIVEVIYSVRFEDEQVAHLTLDMMARVLMARCVAAYEAHELPDKEDVIRTMTLAQADRKFQEAIESIACRGKGGDDAR